MYISSRSEDFQQTFTPSLVAYRLNAMNFLKIYRISFNHSLVDTQLDFLFEWWFFFYSTIVLKAKTRDSTFNFLRRTSHSHLYSSYKKIVLYYFTF